LTSIIEKRRSLHRDIEDKSRQNNDLKFQMGQLQALANIGVSTAMIAHEINNLLTPLGSYAALALQNGDDKALATKALEKTARNCERASKIMQSILAVANGETQEKNNVSLLALVEDIFVCLSRYFSKDGIEVKVEIDGGLKVYGVAVEIQQVLMNLILNAREAMLGRGGILKILAEEKADAVEIRVADTGCGIEAENLEKIFGAFFTTKKRHDGEVGSCGAGLGLAFCKRIVDNYEGSILVESKPAEGTCFTIMWPKANSGSG